MKKKLYFLLLMLLCTTFAFAQVCVQGVPRKLARSAKAEIASVMPNIDFDNIQYWVGNGRNHAALVVKWDDGKGNNTNLVWGYRWSGKATGVDMLKAVAAADPRFYMLVNEGTQYGTAVGGLGYDINGNGNIKLLNGSSSFSLTAGTYNCADYTFDKFTSNDASDHWCAGWYNGYWSYWTTNSLDQAYGYSSVGATSRELTSGCVDGWSYISDMSNWYSNDMSGKLEYVSTLTVPTAKAKIKSATAETGKVTTVNNLKEFAEALKNATDGETIKFREGLRGTEFDTSGILDYAEINNSVTINGNGVVLTNGPLPLNAYPSDYKTIRITDFVFKNLQESAFYYAPYKGGSLTIDRCIFDGVSGNGDGVGCAISGTSASKDINVTISNCRFSNIKMTGKGSVLNIWELPNKDLVHLNLVSCTFADNDKASDGLICVVNAPHVHFANNVFYNNGDGITLNIKSDDAAKDVVSYGYNVINGTITESAKSRLLNSDICSTDLSPVVKFVDGEYQVVKNGAAYNHLPANTKIEGITLPERDVLGTIIDYSQPTQTGACQLVYDENANTDYTKGTFIINEDWYGHQNSTVNFLTNDGEWVYRVVQKENPGIELGCTAQYGQIYGDKFYVTSKQEKDPGASVVGGRVNILNAKTMKMEKQIQTISTGDNGTSNADGRAFLGVDEHKGYVGTSNGIFILDLDKQEIAGSVEGTTNDGGSAYDQLYSGQIGSMIRVNDRVFAVHQKSGLLVIDANTDKVEQAIAAPEGWGFGSVVLSKDGNLWLSLAATSGSGQADNRIVKLNPNTLEQTIIDLPEDIYGPANSWYAWTPDCFCASNQQNVLYWNGGSNSWFSNYTIYKYDIDSNKFSKYLDYTDAADGFYIYGCSFRVDPVSDDAYVSLYKGFGDATYVVRKYDAEGKQLAEYPMISNYWFPSLPVFPDNVAPVIANPVGDLTLAADKTATIDLKDLATDADNFDAAIVKSVKTVSDASVLDAKMQYGSLVITPKKEGKTTVTIKVNSNGKLAESTFAVTVTPATGIKNITTNGAVEVARFSADGKRISAPQKGLNIIRMSDGSTRKVVVK